MRFYTGKVYFELRDISDKHPQEIKFVVYGNASAETVWSRYIAAENGDIAGSPKYLFYTSNFQKESKALLEKFEVRIAGGGVVHESNKLLIIKRNGVYDLPKGHLDEGETIEECAVREVEEETGVKAKITKLLHETFHTYIYKKNYVLKHTYWYEMESIQEGQKLIPQTEEGIEDIIWIPKEEVNKKIEGNTYKSIKDVFLLSDVN